MPDLQDGETTEMKGSGVKPYVLKNGFPPSLLIWPISGHSDKLKDTAIESS